MAKDDFKDIYAPLELHRANAGKPPCGLQMAVEKACIEQGTKHDEGKPPLSMVSRELLEHLAKVRAFGAQKYTRYEKCDCALSAKSETSTRVSAAKTATTSGLKNETPRTSRLKATITVSGPDSTGKYSQSITVDGPETKPLADTVLPEKRLTLSLTPDARFAEELLEFVSTIATPQEKSGARSVFPVMSASDGLKNPSGTSGHSPTCASTKTVMPGRDNWRKGFKYTRSIDAALRHISAFNGGEDRDRESGETHIAHAIACLEHLLHDYLYRAENDDRYKR